MKKRFVSMFLAAVMAGTMVAAVPVMAEEATEAATEAADCSYSGDLADKKGRRLHLSVL